MKRGMRTILTVLAAAALLPALAGSTLAQERYEPVTGINTLKRLEESVAELVKRYYPEATTNSFHNVVHFEHATRLYVREAIVKVPAGREAPREVVRGPGKGGVWCDLAVGNGPLPPIQRADGVLERGGFREHFFAIGAGGQSYALVTLRLPLEPTEKEEEFVVALREHLAGYGDFIDRQTRAPSGIDLPGIGADGESQSKED